MAVAFSMNAFYLLRNELRGGGSAPGEDVDGGSAVQGSLGQNGCRRSAAAKQDRVLSLTGEARVPHGLQKAIAVGIVAKELSVPVYDGIDCARLKGRNRKGIHPVVHKPFQGHGAVPACGPQGDQPVNGPLKMRFVYGKSQIYAVNSQFLEGSVVHGGGYAVGNRISQQTGKLCSACYVEIFVHFYTFCLKLLGLSCTLLLRVQKNRKNVNCILTGSECMERKTIYGQNSGKFDLLKPPVRV